jgi:YbbR domain-containing protein
MRWVKSLVDLVTQNFWWKLLSLAIAVVVWGLVANEAELSTFVTVSVEYKNLPEELEISSDPVSSVKLELRGPSGELRDVDSRGNRPEVILDMSKVRTGEQTFPIGDGSVKLMRGVTLVRAIPSEVRFTFERSLERTVKVVPRFTERSGFEVADFRVSPDSMHIAGPASRVNNVGSVQTDPVNIPGKAGSFEFPVNTFLDDPYIRFKGVARVTVTVDVRKK